MDTRKWLLKRISSDMSPGESESSGSLSSFSERYSDEQDALREPPICSMESPEVTSKSEICDDEVMENVPSLREKLSAALVNISAKEELVKQHAKVAEEAVAGWEKSENEVAELKEKLEASLKQNANLELRVSHLDGALKECARQLRQSKDEKNIEWESEKTELEKQIHDLQAQLEASVSQKILESLEKTNATLKQELDSRSNDLEFLKIERDLSTEAAELASKQLLESVKKFAKLEGECKRLQSEARKSPLVNDKQFKNEKLVSKNLADFSVEIEMMDDFLEMERLASSSLDTNDTQRGEFEMLIEQVSELEKKLDFAEAEKLELKNALDESKIGLEELRKEMKAVTESKEFLEFHLASMEAESRTMSAYVDSLKRESEKDRILSAELTVKCRELENELARKIEETELRKSTNSNDELKLKQDDISLAADKLAECQKTIASLGIQLQSLATLEDFLIDTSNISGLSIKDMNLPKNDSDHLRKLKEDFSNLGNRKNEESPPNGSSSTSSTSLATSGKSRNGFGKFFSRSKSVKENENR